MTVVTVADIAKARGWHRAYAYKWLRRIELEHGEPTVWRKGRALMADAERLAHVTEPDLHELLAQAINRIELLESAYTGQDKRIDGISRDLVDIRRRERERSKRK